MCRKFIYHLSYVHSGAQHKNKNITDKSIRIKTIREQLRMILEEPKIFKKYFEL